MGVIPLADWQNIRSRHFSKGESIKAISRATGRSKNTIRKYLRSALPPPPDASHSRISILAPYAAEIRDLIKATPKITAARIVSVLRKRHDTSLLIKARAARKYIARIRPDIVQKEAFVRLVYSPGSQMQIDFKDIYLLIHGEATKHYLFTAKLCYSGAIFGYVFRSEDTPSLLEGIVRACTAFGGSARECVFDNAKTAVKRVYPGRKRDVGSDYQYVCGSLGMQMHFAAPAKGNEKGGVGSAHGEIEDNFFRPIQSGENLLQVNKALRQFCNDRNERNGKKLFDEQASLLPLPDIMPSAERCVPVRINKFAEARFGTNRYSVPSQYAHRDGILRVSSDRVTIAVNDQIVAVHHRSFQRHGAVLDPLHYIDLLSLKHRAVERAEVFTVDTFPETLKQLLRTYVDIDRDIAGKQFMRVIELLKDYDMNRVLRAVTTAIKRGTSDPAAIALLLSQGDSAYRNPEPLYFSRSTTIHSVDLSDYAVSRLEEPYL